MVNELIGSKKDEIVKKKYSIFEISDSIDDFRGSVLINYKYTPKQVEKLELQSNNYRGLFYIYNSIVEEIAKINKEKK